MDQISLPQVFRNLAGSYGELYLLLEAIAYVMAALSALFGLFLLYRAGDVSNRGREQPMGWFWSMLVSVVLFALPEFITNGARQIFGEQAEVNPLAYAVTSHAGPALAPLAGALMLFGFFFSMRGLWILRAVGVNGNHTNGASFGKGMTMVVSGICLVNLRDLMSVLSSLTGLNVGAGLFS